MALLDQSIEKSYRVFFELIKAGLWENEACLLHFGEIDYQYVFDLAKKQSVIGLVAAGMEHVMDVKIPQHVKMPYVGATLQIEQRNKSMNLFINQINELFGKSDVSYVIVKGQGIAQCYERPLWRASGDIDYLLDAPNFVKAKNLLSHFDKSILKVDESRKHINSTISSWDIELHANQDCGLSRTMDRELGKVQYDIFHNGGVRFWNNCGSDIILPDVDNDVVLIFTHFLKHFYKEGLGIRQICDWCRLLWFFRKTIDQELLEMRIKKMGLMSEWKAFAAYSVEFLGMPMEYMPFYDNSERWKNKARKINQFVMRVGNMGHCRTDLPHGKYPFVLRKLMAVSRRLADLINHASIFPLDTLRFFPYIMFNGIRLAAKGIG